LRPKILIGPLSCKTSNSAWLHGGNTIRNGAPGNSSKLRPARGPGASSRPDSLELRFRTLVKRACLR
jgi:hypothetical protein